MATVSTDLLKRLQLDKFCLASRSNTHDSYAVAVVDRVVMYAHVQTGTCLSKIHAPKNLRRKALINVPKSAKFAKVFFLEMICTMVHM